MICYPANITDAEIAALNDYWLLSENTATNFCYTLKQINARYKADGARSVSGLIQKSCFLLQKPSFYCQDCNCKFPVINRKQYMERVEGIDGFVCKHCINIRQERLIDEARHVLQEFKKNIFQPYPYLSDLSVLESMALLAISTGKASRGFISETTNEAIITGICSIDRGILQTLINKKALIYINELPAEVKSAEDILYGTYRNVTYDNHYHRPARYRNPDAIIHGVYLNALIVDGDVEIDDVASFICQKVKSVGFCTVDISQIHPLIKSIQLEKLYALVHSISKEYEIRIDNSSVLLSLLNHLAEHYPPQNIYYTFKCMARDVIVYMHKEKKPEYISKNYFTKFVSDYIQYVENNGYMLKKVWTLPPQVQTAPFEAMFSQLYLNGHFNWNRLSVKDVSAIWLENINLEADAQKTLGCDIERHQNDVNYESPPAF
jgi:hypothetical protein